MRPTAEQLRWQELRYGMFCHFGINTFNGLEWSDGTLDPAGFAPGRLDARQWVETALAAGMRYLILTAKHHDGFCLWPTETTEYSVRASGYKGDVVGEVAAACEELGMPFGVYLSPWDRHEPCYPDAAAYDRFYARQLTELLTQYGPLVEVWFDGAGSEGRVYDWDSIMAVVDRYQPQAAVFNMGRPTIRWIGNEDGLAAESTYYAVSEAPGGDPFSAALLAKEPRYLPPECDVSIRKGWFWHPDEGETLKSLEHLLGIYYRSVGRGANLLLNVPPDREGLIDDADRARLLELAGELERRFSVPIVGRIAHRDEAEMVDFGQPVAFDHLVLEEYLDDGQRIDRYRIVAEPDGREIARGTTIGSQWFVMTEEVRASGLRIEVGDGGGRLRGVTAYRTGETRLPDLP